MSSPLRRRRLIMDANRNQLAIDGGAPSFPGGPPPWPLADEYVRESLLAAYESGAWGRYHGPHVAHLEGLIAERHDVKFALACCSGTLAMELALRGLKIGPGDEVILAGYDFSGNFRAVEATGARPVLVDLAAGAWCFDPPQIVAAIGDETRAIVASHLHGSIAPMRQIMEIATDRGLAVVEDACQAQGALVESKTAGTWGDVGVWSFGGSKLLTAGRGGAIFTRREDVFQRAKVFCERGNNAFAMSELQAAVLPPQIAKLIEYNQRRQAAAAWLVNSLSDVTCLTPADANPPDSQPSYYKQSWFYNPQQCGGRPREAFIAAAHAEGIALDAGFRGFVRRPRSRCRQVGELPHSAKAAEQTLVLHHPVLLRGEPQLQQAADGLRKICQLWGEER